MLFRPARIEDLEQIFQLATKRTVGLTTLPTDRVILEERLTDSQKSFEYPPKKPRGELFLFVLEDTDAQTVVGISGVVTKVGGFEPFYTYEIKTQINESAVLGVHKEIQYLQLKIIHSGLSEIGTLFLDPDYRLGLNGRQLSLSRFLFIAEYAHFFEKEILAEMRGVIDSQGHSPFWDALGRHFFDVEYEIADLMVMKDKSFIDDLMPKHPIYIPLLSISAQKVIGKVHEYTLPALKLLEQEGFHFNGEIDIFEAGPTVSCPTHDIRTVKQSKSAIVSEIQDTITENMMLIGNPASVIDFCVTVGTLDLHQDGTVTLPEPVAKVLNVSLGERVRYSPIR
jgi:arginine N-succinyltransferase